MTTRNEPRKRITFRDDREEDEEQSRPVRETPARSRAKKELMVQHFNKLWASLMTTPIHLDSALSKEAASLKSIIAQIVPAILLRPASQAEMLGIGVPPDEPWQLNAQKLAHWRPATLMAERLYELLVQKPIVPAPTRADFPAGMIEELEKTFSAKVADELVDVLAREAPLSLRAARKVGAPKLLEGIKDGGRLPVKAELSDLSPLGVRLHGYAPVLGTELYKSGSFEIQDEGSQVMALFSLFPERFAPLLQQNPGRAKTGSRAIELPKDVPAWTVIDACAGAGGKTLALADALGGKGRIYSYDTSAKKLQALKRRSKHAGYNNVQAVAVKEGEEKETVSRFRRRANVVLVDAPCTGWGVLRRNPDIKWRQSTETLAKMPEIQKRVLSLYSDLVAPGGRLVFGVCTFRRAETREVVDAFLARHPDFEAREGGYLGPGPCDGFFMQAFQRKG
ncbi:MAG: RsmB/NOP family class I SAM-dependent RNA methyltransferase [Bdellovibrionota bacterium]